MNNVRNIGRRRDAMNVNQSCLAEEGVTLLVLCAHSDQMHPQDPTTVQPTVRMAFFVLQTKNKGKQLPLLYKACKTTSAIPRLSIAARIRVTAGGSHSQTATHTRPVELLPPNQRGQLNFAWFAKDNGGDAAYDSRAVSFPVGGVGNLNITKFSLLDIAATSPGVPGMNQAEAVNAAKSLIKEAMACSSSTEPHSANLVDGISCTEKKLINSGSTLAPHFMMDITNRWAQGGGRKIFLRRHPKKP